MRKRRGLAGLNRSTAYEWHNRYEEDGIEGLRDRPCTGRQPRVDAVTSARFKERIVAGAALERDGVVAFRGVDALQPLRRSCLISCSQGTPTPCGEAAAETRSTAAKSEKPERFHRFRTERFAPQVFTGKRRAS
jgi:Helix-turn-helix domain